MPTSDPTSRLDFLMRLTDTKNVQLARVLNFDASYISRLRAGRRHLPETESFCVPAARFFVRCARKPYQRDALAREIADDGAWPADDEEATRLVAAWLQGTELAPYLPSVPKDEVDQPSAEATKLLFGDEGRRQGALMLLERVRDAGTPRNLLLHSDEDAAWMLQDAQYLRRWSSLMLELARLGCTFTVVHTLSRDASAMWEGVSAWIPLYLTGAIRPYHYPRLRDGVRRRSLFVAEGLCALSSDSVGTASVDTLSVLFFDPRAVRSLEGEATAYLALCRPLMEHVEGPDALATLAHDFAAETDAAHATLTSGALLATREGFGAIVCADTAPRCAYLVREDRLACAIADAIAQTTETVEVGDAASALVASVLTASA